MTKNDKLDELSKALFGWVEEDEDNRSVMLIAGDEESVRNAYRGSRSNLVESLANAMLKDKKLRSMCARALALCERNKENDNDTARTE